MAIDIDNAAVITDLAAMLQHAITEMSDHYRCPYYVNGEAIDQALTTNLRVITRLLEYVVSRPSFSYYLHRSPIAIELTNGMEVFGSIDALSIHT